jgi:hypothetical protein
VDDIGLLPRHQDRHDEHGFLDHFRLLGCGRALGNGAAGGARTVTCPLPNEKFGLIVKEGAGSA